MPHILFVLKIQSFPIVIDLYRHQQNFNVYEIFFQFKE